MSQKKRGAQGGKPSAQTIKQVTSLNTTFNFKYLSLSGFGIVGSV